MLSRLFSCVLACALVCFTIAGVGGVAAISSEPPAADIPERPLDVVLTPPASATPGASNAKPIYLASAASTPAVSRPR